jgi:predicted glycoside hydrolase/deacetylase ChbG (UPF0249 family)
MNANPVLRRLGLSDDDRVAIIHADDVGMCQATLPAFDELLAFGLVSCGAAMVPCPWFPALAAYCRQHPQADMGVHLTLTSEWDTYRWGPLSTRDPASGLLDEEGYFYREPEDVQSRADAAVVQAELETQVSRALTAGIDVTHVDTHMGTLAHFKYISAYVGLALQHGLPALVLRLDEAGWREMGLDAETARMAVQMVAALEAQGMPLIDHMESLPLDQPEERLEQARRAFDGLKPGVTHFIIHPAMDTPELRAITPDWRCRVGDYQAFSSEALRRHIREAGIHVIGYRALRALLPTTDR